MTGCETGQEGPLLEDRWFTPDRLEECAVENQVYLAALMPHADTDDMLERLREGDALLSRMLIDATIGQAYDEFNSAIDKTTGLKQRSEFDKWTNGVFGLGRVDERRRPQENMAFPNSLTVLRTDINNFKKLNDKLGHDMGDIILRVVADELHAVLRAGDNFVAVRESGDENLVGIAHLSPEQSRGLWQRIFRAQRKKTDQENQQRLWRHIDEALDSRPASAGKYELIEARYETETFEDVVVEKSVLYINNRRIVPLDELTVVDVGVAYDVVTDKVSVHSIYQAAEQHRNKVKEDTRSKVGGAYRDTTTRQETLYGKSEA